MKKLHLTIVTPERVIYEANVERVTVPTASGEITVLANHIPLISVVATGALRVKDADGNVAVFAVHGGALEVIPDSRMVILADQSEAVSDIDLERAQAAYNRAQEAMEQKDSEIDNFDLIQSQLEKHLNRLRVAKKWQG